MPIPFSTIPDHIKTCIVEKQNVYDFVKFQESSRDAFLISNKLRTRLSLDKGKLFVSQKNDEDLLEYFGKDKKYFIKAENFIDIPIRIEFSSARVLVLTDSLCRLLTNFFSKSNSCLRCLEVVSVQCSPTHFNSLLTATNVKLFACFQKTSPNFVRVPNINNISELILMSKCSVNDADILNIQAPKMHLYDTKISNKGINLIIKECLSGERKVSNISILHFEYVDTVAVFEGIPYSFVEGNPSKSTFAVQTKDAPLYVDIAHFNRPYIRIYTL